MTDRLDNLRVVDPVLTEIIRGYSNNQLISPALFPIATVEKESGKIVQFGKQAFKIHDTERAIRADSNRINLEGRSTIPYSLTEHDLEAGIDYREKEEDMFPLRENAANITNEAIALKREKLAADLAQNAANYPTGHKVTLTGTAKWSDLANSDPLADVETGKEKIRSVIGKRPNTLVMGASTFSNLKFHPKLIELIKYTGEGARKLVTTEMMKALFDVESFWVGEPVYSNDAGVFSDVWLDNVILAWVPQGSGQNRFNPSFGYTYRKKNQPLVDSYTEKGGKVDIVRTTDIFQSLIVGNEAGYLITDTN